MFGGSGPRVATEATGLIMSLFQKLRSRERYSSMPWAVILAEILDKRVQLFEAEL